MHHEYQMERFPIVVRRWGGEAGGEYVLWAEYVHTIADMIRRFDLEVIKEEYLLRIKPFPGGKRGPHLHYGNAVYAVTPEQWKVFTHTVVKECRERLDRAMEVSLPLDAVAEIGGMTAGLPR